MSKLQRTILPGVEQLAHFIRFKGNYSLNKPYPKGRCKLKNIWVPLSGAIAQQRNVETIANNVANANTPGFKRDQLVFKEYLTAVEKTLENIDLPRKEWAPEDFYRSYGAEHGMVKVEGSYTIHEQGPLTPTGNPLDLGINGNGFFEVLTPNGVRFTRKGIFTINNNRELVTSEGHKVLSKNNPETPTPPSERTINIIGNKISVGQSGQIYNQERKIADLSVVEFKDPHSLRKEGTSLFINKDLKNIMPDLTKTSVHQGFVEGSNVNAISEMSALIKAHRHFDSIQNALKTYDQISGKAVNEISRF